MRVAIIGRSEYTYESALLLLEHGHEIPIIITAKEAPEYYYTSKDFEALANKIGAKFIHTPKINKPEVIEQIKSCGEINISVSINYSGVIEDEVISLFPYGILNAHAGDLPKYRGNACMAWAIINGEDKIGLCIHKMIPGELDSGDIIVRKYFPVHENTRVGEGFEWMRKETPGMMLEAITHLQKDKNYFLQKQSLNPKDALRGYPRTPDDGKIDWSKSNLEILRLINASSEPFPGAYCALNSSVIRVWRAEVFDDGEIYLAAPGQISKINHDNGSVEVITGKGKLLITDVTVDQTRSTPADFIKSTRQRLT
ncbi:MAG: formyl transferase [Bacteroidetes bacterium]|nr:formyl transferase [Bacteroidota bacterium]HNR18917.1 formyltransferase family protein [Bacteroidia bacterium]HNU33598.1 formyltransferase family protein [Bacteroidia bacterium]